MALTVDYTRSTGWRFRTGKVTFDDSYATGGESLVPSDFGLEYIGWLDAHPVSGYTFSYDYANQKLLVYRVATHTHDLYLKNSDQADGASNRVNAAADKLGANTGSSLTITGLAASATAHGGVQGVAASVLAEVGSGVDLSAVAVRVLVYGL